MPAEMKWTPGPWLDGIYHAKRDGGRTLAFVTKPGRLVPVAVVDLGPDGYGREEGEANARLISAAPEMAEALAGIQWKSADRDNMEFTARITYVQMGAIRAALKNAGG